MITHIHHINFIVQDLESAISQFERLLGMQGFIKDSLEKRAVATARIKLGDTWLVLVQPVDDESVPAKFLQENGEGFFLISLGTDDLERQLKRMEEQNISPNSETRRGLENWLVADLPINQFFGEQFQLCEEVNKPN